MKIGTIIKNEWASDGNPTQYSIYTGVKGKYATGLVFVNGRLEPIRYYKKDFSDETKFVPVGYCNGFDIIKQALKARGRSDYEPYT
jgi:hypothetical protein